MIGYRAAIHAAAYLALSAMANAQPHRKQPLTRNDFDAYVRRLPVGQYSVADKARIRLEAAERRAERLASRVFITPADRASLEAAARRRETRAARRRAEFAAGGWTNRSRFLAA